MPKAVVVGWLGLVVAVLSAGCGRSGTLTRQQYVSRLNAMCSDFRDREQRIGEPQTLADLVTKEPQILDAFKEAIANKVGTLKAPDAIADRAERLVHLANKQRRVLAALIDAAKDNNVAKVRALVSRNEVLNRQADRIARDLGADACTQG